MAVCVVPDVNNILSAVTTAVESCTGYVLVDSNEYQLMLQTYATTPLEIAGSFTWGFGTYIGFWFLGYAIKNARQVIRGA